MAWKIWTMADAYMERPPVQYAVEGFFEFPSVNIVYGAPSSLKSMLMLDMAMCVAAGRPWLTNLEGIVPKATTKTNVLWVDFDNGRRTTSDRVRAVGKHYQVAADDLSFRYVSCPSTGLNMGNVDSVLNLEKAIEDTETKLVIVDNLGLVTGGADENSNGMIPIMGAFRALAEKHKVAFVIVHHERKGSDSHQGRSGDTLRGHSSIEGALDRSFRVTREKRSNKVTVMPVKERGANIQPFSAYFNHININNGPELAEGWFEGVDVNSVSRDAEKSALSLLKQGEKNQSDLVDHIVTVTGVSEKKAREILQLLVDNKKIVFRAGAKNAKLYSLESPEQMILSKNTDLVGYIEEIKPTSGYIQ